MLICGDWGTSSLRLRLVDVSTGVVVAETASDRGIAATYAAWQEGGAAGDSGDSGDSGASSGSRAAFYLDVLSDGIRLLGPGAAGVDIVLSGMASANIGLRELPYKELPIRADGSDLLCARLEASSSFPHRILLISGVRSARDVMRGEETQLAGCPPAEGPHRYIFPGTHSKHILVRDGNVLDFQTYMTGEFFALLSRQSLLARSVTENVSAYPGAFAQGVADGAGANLLRSAFWVRTNQLLDRLHPLQNYHYLSGLLIGSELGSLSSDNIPITIVGNVLQTEQYAAAASVLGLTHVHALEGSPVSIKGQCLIWNHFIRQDS